MHQPSLYDYSPIIHRPKLEWPNGARLACWVGLNVEHFEIDKSSTSIAPITAGFIPDPLNCGWRDYGTRVGVWRMMELLDNYQIRASVPLNSDVCRQYPQIIDAGSERSWVWLVHGKNHSTKQTGQPFRHKHLDRALDYITGHEQVWVTTSDEIADWYYQHYYDPATAASSASRS